MPARHAAACPPAAVASPRAAAPASLRPRLLRAAALAFVVAAGTAFAGAASELTDGLWRGSTEGEGGTIGLRASIVGDAGELRLEASGRVFKGTLRCRYLLRLSDGAIEETVRRANLSSPDCPQAPELTLSPGEDDALALKIGGQAMPELPPATLRRRVGPVPPALEAVIPEGFDVLGARLGASRAEIEGILVGELGYAAQADRFRRIEDAGYVAEVVHYGRKPDYEDATVADDIVVIAYQGGPDAQTAAAADARAVSIRRFWVTHPDAQISTDALAEAVAAKYGEGEITRFFDRTGERAGGMVKEGRLLTRPRPYCREEMTRSGREGGVYEQPVSVPGEPPSFTTGVFALCGSFASATITERLSRKTGLKHPVLDLHLAAYELMSDELWKRVAARLSVDLETNLARESPTQSSVQPRL
ncbi:MAG: hypothetical protein AAF371_17765 [Pseudomonadota bacterium]